MNRFALAPRILLMDEPFAALDEITRTDMRHLLSRLCEETGASVVFVTHSLPEAVFLSDKVVIMGARPGHVTDIIDVDLPRPRTEETRRDPRFVELTGFVWDRLRGMIQQDERAA